MLTGEECGEAWLLFGAQHAETLGLCERVCERVRDFACHVEVLRLGTPRAAPPQDTEPAGAGV